MLTSPIARRPRTPVLGEFGIRLRGLRRDTGLTGRDLAQRCGLTQPTISKIERGLLTPTPETFDLLLTALDVDDSERDELRALLDAAVDFGRRVRRTDIAMEGHVAIVYRELMARRVRCFAPMILPALLQTAGYAAELVEERPWFAHCADAAISKKLDRQAVLYEPERTFDFVLTDAALSSGPMAGRAGKPQRDRLNSLVTLPNVRIRIVRPDVSKRRLTLPWCAFALYDDTVAAISTFIDDTLLVDPAHVVAYIAAFNHLAVNARDLTERDEP